MNKGKLKYLGGVSLVPDDEWVASKTYPKLYIVSHLNKVYISKQQNVGIEPNVSTNWNQFWMYIPIEGSITVDDTLSETSENPVQNKVITLTLQGKQDALTVEQQNAVNSGIDSEKVAQIETNAQDIENLRNSPDVVDIVSSYAELLLKYPENTTTTLGNQDIVRVLTDENHNNQSSYYQWNKPTHTWSYIGSVGNYYTKSQVDAKLANKADKVANAINGDFAALDENGNLIDSGKKPSDFQDKLIFDSTPTAGSTNPVTSEGIKTAIDNAIVAVYKPQGKSSVSTLNGLTKTASMNGYVYDMTDSGVLTNYDGTTESVKAKDNVVFLWNDGDWYWDNFGEVVDLSGYVQKTTEIAGLQINNGISASDLLNQLFTVSTITVDEE